MQAIADMPAPHDIPSLLRFPGMIRYVQRFIPNMSEIAQPLRILLTKNITWHWQSEQEKAFKELKQNLKSTPVLQKPIVLQVDACQSRLGAVILQEGKPVAMTSRALDSATASMQSLKKKC